MYEHHFWNSHRPCIGCGSLLFDHCKVADRVGRTNPDRVFLRKMNAHYGRNHDREGTINSVTLYALGKRDRSYRVQWLLGELGIGFDLVWLDGQIKEHKSAQFLGINLFGTVPAIDIGGIKMFDSGAVMTSLLERDSTHVLAPAREDTAARAEFWQWFFFGATTLDPTVFRFIGEKLGEADPSRQAETRTQVERLLALLDDHLRQRQTLLGERFTAADIMVGYCLANLSRHLLLDDYPGLAACLDRLKKRPAAQAYFEAIAESVPQP